MVAKNETNNDLQSVLAKLEAAQAENASLKANALRMALAKVTIKVSEKGACSVYGLGRFPVTLYKEQWAKLFGMVDEVKTFIAKNDGLLRSKDSVTPAEVAARVAKNNAAIAASKTAAA